MNPHYHPYGAPPDLQSPHPPSPDQGYHPRMHPSNGHSIGPLGHANSGPHEPQQSPHPHMGYPGGPGGSPHHQQMHNPTISTTNNTGGPNGQVKVCAGCGGKIVERYLLHALDRYWHNGCLKCSCCGAQLADLGTSCFTRSGMILCRQDYMRMFGSSGACAACGVIIPASELVMKCGGGAVGPQPVAPPHVFHVKCFTCSKCGTPLIPGDRYYMLAGSLVCEQDWSKLVKSSAAAPNNRKGKVGRPRRSRD